MEAVFSIPTSHNISEAGDSVMVRGNVAVGSLHPSSVKYVHSPTLGLSHSNHSTMSPLTPASLSSIASTDHHHHHLIHFTDDLNLCMKHSPDNSLVDDEDEDVRSLLAAAAAVAASANVPQQSPIIQSSSSGLNTPPDTRIVRPLDSTLKAGHLCDSVEDSSMLVPRLNLTRSSFTNSDDLNILIPSSAQHDTASYIASRGVSTPSNSPVMMYQTQSPSSHASTCIPTNLLHGIGPSVVMLNCTHSSYSSLATDSYPIRFTISNASLGQMTSTVSSNEGFVSTQTEDNLFNSLSYLMSTKPSSSTSSPSSPSSSLSQPLLSLDSHILNSVNSPQLPSLQSKQSIEDYWPDTSMKADSDELSDCHLDLLTNHQLVAKVSVDENFNLDRVITSHSVSLPIIHDNNIKIDSDYDVIKENDDKQNIIDSLNKENSGNSNYLMSMSSFQDVSDLKEPEFPDLCSEDSISNINKFVGEEKNSFTLSPLITSNTSDVNGVDIQVKTKTDDDCVQSNCTTHTIMNANAEPISSTIDVIPVLDSSVGFKESVDDTDVNDVNERFMGNIFNRLSENLHGNDLQNSITEASKQKDEEVCNDLEYAAAAVAAVQDVVYALAGNRKPDPSLVMDPALEGTGTDRLYTLSLAPVHYGVHSDSISHLSNINNSSLTSLLLNPQLCISSCTSVNDSFTTVSQSQSDNMGNCTESVSNKQDEIKDEFICLTCNKVFAQRALLIKHRVIHEDPKHVCESCGRSFLREDKLKRHIMSIHTAEKPHICIICTKAFSRKDKLKDHLKHHERAARNFECQECRQPFVQKSDLNRHIRGVHQGEPGVGINMIVKRKAPGTAPIRLSKRKLKTNAVNDVSSSILDETKELCTYSQTERSLNGDDRNSILDQTKVKPDSNIFNSDQRLFTNNTNYVTNSIVSYSTAVVASITAVAASLSSLSATLTPSMATHPVFAAGASSLVLPTMAFTQAHHQFVQQQVMLPGTGIASMAAVHPSALALQQQQFFAMAAMPALAQTVVSQSAPVTGDQQSQAVSIAHDQSQQIHFQPELKAVNTPSGPMMVLTRIAATNQTPHAQPLTGQTVFPQVVGFHASALHQHQIQQHQLLQQQQLQLQQQQAAAFAAQQQAAAAAAHGFLFPASAGGATAVPSATPTAFFCHPQEGMAAGLILASSTNPTGFALAAAAAAAQHQSMNAQTAPVNGIPVSGITGLQTVTGYTSVSEVQQQQLFLQQQQQCLASSAGVIGAPTAAIQLVSSGLPTHSILNGNSSNIVPTSNSNIDDPMINAQPAQFVMTQRSHQQDVGAVNNYQLAAFTNAAAALYQHQHPGFMFTAHGAVNSGSAAAIALHHQQQQFQQQQVNLMTAAAYQQQHAVQQQQ